MVTTRKNAYKDNSPPELESLASSLDTLNLEPTIPTLETLNDRRRRWSRLLTSQNYQPVIEEVLEEELPKYERSTVIDVKERISHMRDCALILSSASSVFFAAAHGTLAQRILTDKVLQQDYAAIQERAHHQPSIYIHQLADENGIALTPDQYLLVRDMMLDYLMEGATSQHACHLDNISAPPVRQKASAKGHRKYLQTTNRSSRRIETLRRFCQGIQDRWHETDPSLRDHPFPFPPGECGYSKNSHIRLAQHRARQSSNYVMNLVEDICTYLHRTGVLKQRFQMHQFVIYLIFRPSQAAIAEIFCSGLLQVWVEDGGGFNAYPAGRSVATARRMSEMEWIEHERWVRQRSPVVENMRVLQVRADEWRKALEWEECAGEGSEMHSGSAEESG